MQSIETKNLIGLRLGIDEIVADVDEFKFWGWINGIDNDYYIVMGLKYEDEFQFPSKCFYGCQSNNFKFRKLKKTQKGELKFLQGNDDFKGVFDTILYKREEE